VLVWQFYLFLAIIIFSSPFTSQSFITMWISISLSIIFLTGQSLSKSEIEWFWEQQNLRYRISPIIWSYHHSLDDSPPLRSIRDLWF
jgi:hypothetical protein